MPLRTPNLHDWWVDIAEARRRIEFLEESLVELLDWVTSQDEYDDQFDEDSAWIDRLRPHVRADGLVPVSVAYENTFMDFAALPERLDALAAMVARAECLLPVDRRKAAEGRAELRRRVEARKNGQ